MTFEQIICLAKYYYGKKLQSSIICKSYLKCKLKAMPIKIFILPCIKNCYNISLFGILGRHWKGLGIT